MSFSAIGLKILIMTDNYASYNKRFFFETSCPTYEAGELRKSEFSFFSSPPYQHLLNHTNNAICTQILCASGIFINGPVIIVITRHVLDFRKRFYMTLKLATKVLKCIILKIHYIYSFCIQLLADFYFLD